MHRLAADLTLEALAERSGVSVRTISDIERGVSVAPQRRTVEAIATGLQLDGQQRDAILREARARRAVPAEGQRATAVAPHRVSDFTGREREITEVVSLLAPTEAGDCPPVMISGPPGIGKTTSALEAMNRIREDGQPTLFVDLDGFSPLPLAPLQVVRALLRQMPGIGEKVPASLDEATMLWQSATAENPPIVLLDNAAHENQVRPVLTLDPRSKVVITSRRTLAGLEGVRRMTLGPLSTEESVTLLARLIPAAQRVAGDLSELAELCDHIPLAMRIAGNRIASRPASQAGDFVARMRSSENRLRLLVAGDLAVESAFALSYDDLDAQTAALFRAISVIDTGTFDARIAAATLDVDVIEIDLRLDELTDLGLLEARGGNRYRLHDLLRLFAAARLVAVDGPDGARVPRDRLRSWLMGTLERAGAWFEPDRSPDLANAAGAVFAAAETAEAWIRIEEHHWWPAMQSAAQAGEHAAVVDVADSLHWFSELWLEWGHWLELFSLARDSAQKLSDRRLEAMHLGYMVWATILETRDRERGLELARLAVTTAEASGDHQQRGWAYWYLGWMLRRDHFDEAVVACRESVSLFDLAGDTAGSAQAMIQLSSLLHASGDSELAIDEFRRVLERVEASRSTTHNLVQMITELSAHQHMSRSFLALNRPTEAIESATSALAVAEAFGSETRIAEALRFRATAHLAAGNVDDAEADISKALSGLDANTKLKYILAEREKLEALREGVVIDGL
jgi:transcriptional regulator with XRE-family HTH domain/tetratricopeptide (TPR) repeat protein